MAHNKKKIFLQAKDIITQKKLFFIEDVVACLPISKPTFYVFFPTNSDEFNELKDLMEKNKIELKVTMRNKWYKSDAPALQMALYKLISTPDELKKLSMQHQDITTNGETISFGSFLKKSDPVGGE